MTPIEAHKAILQQWMAQWPPLSSNVPYAIDNRKLEQPSPPFAIVEITNLAADQVTLGPEGHRRFERSGLIEVRLFDARDQGRGQLDALSYIVTQIYEGKRIGGGVTTYATNVRELRDNREYPDLWCVVCRTGFEYHDRR